MTNNSWSFRPAALPGQLRVEKLTVINDFGAVAHAAARAPDSEFLHLCGPEGPLPAAGTISVIGPGTGLGVAHLHRFAGGYHIQATEGGHVDFAPVDAIDDAMLLRLRKRHRRVSVERVVSGPGIVAIHEALAAYEGRPIEELEDTAIWQAGLENRDNLAVAAVERFCQSLGSVAGDYALAHGAAGVVIAGGLGQRLRNLLPSSGFAERFRFKGRYEQMMAGIPVKLITLGEPGLYGAAAAFAAEHS
jgi:glucokinase